VVEVVKRNVHLIMCLRWSIGMCNGSSVEGGQEESATDQVLEVVKRNVQQFSVIRIFNVPNLSTVDTSFQSPFYLI